MDCLTGCLRAVVPACSTPSWNNVKRAAAVVAGAASAGLAVAGSLCHEAIADKMCEILKGNDPDGYARAYTEGDLNCVSTRSLGVGAASFIPIALFLGAVAAHCCSSRVQPQQDGGLGQPLMATTAGSAGGGTFSPRE